MLHAHRLTPCPASRPYYLFVRLVLLLVLALPLWSSHALAQDASTPFRARLTEAKAQLDTIEGTLSRPVLDDAALVRLREQVDAPRADLATLQMDVGGPRDATRARLDKLGGPPKPGEPPESKDITEARQREQALFGNLDGIGKEAQAQVVRADQLANTITERRRDAFTRQLTERSSSIADPFFWLGTISDLPRAGWSLSIASQDAWTYFRLRIGVGPASIALSILFAGALVGRLGRARIAHWRRRRAQRPHAQLRLSASLEVVLTLLHAMLGWPLAALTVLLALAIPDLCPERVLDQIVSNIAFAIAMAVAYDATARGILSADRPDLRLLPLSDWAVRRIGRRVRWVAIILGLAIVTEGVGKAIYAPISLTVAATALTSLLFALVAMSLLIRLRSAPPSLGPDGSPLEEDINKLDILRPLLWMAVIAIFVCLLTGYVALASFFAFFPLVALFVVTLAYVLMILIDAALTEGLAADASRGRAVANAIGVRAKNVAFAATLLSGLLRFLILVVAVVLLGSPLGIYSTDLVSVIQRAFFGFQIGGFTISPSSILLGIVLFGLVIGVARLVRRWVGSTLLPRTTLDAGLQNSIATIVGYCGVVLAIAVALSEVGLDLQNIAIVAGALSVGIGFGLQSIVSNFVSGLILLAERPIRVGDIIAVGGEEGFVRRISVRATQIETYDRATLIIPNSQLITGVVKNWVYGNTWSRVRLTLNVGYDSDVEAVRAAMLSAAADDPRILPSPPPRVFLGKLGDASLEFELIVVVASVETMPAVKSDLQLRILKQFREKGLRMAAQLPAAPAPVVVSLQEALASVESARAGGDKVSEG